MKDFKNSFTDLFGLHTINDGVHCRGNEKVNIGNESWHIGRGSFPKSMDKGQADQRNIEDGYSSYMRDASAEGFFALLWRCNAKNRADDQNIGEEDEDRVHSSS